MSNLTPIKKQNFLFIREKLVTKLRQFTKTVFLDAGNNRHVTATTLHALGNDIAVSHSGRTLAQILSLSYSQDLSVYTVDKVVPGFGREGTKVHYSRPESEFAEFRSEAQVKHDEQQAKLNKQQAEIDELTERIGGNLEVLSEWQTACLVICAFGTFAWNLVSPFHQAELSRYRICQFWDLHYAQSKSGPARNSARRIYNNIDENVRSYASNLVGMKANMAESRRKLAHPSIPDGRLLKFLSELGSGDAGLEPIEIEMFSYLESRSNHPQNIECAIRGGLRLS